MRSDTMKKIAIFGSTGSIGESTLNVIRQNAELFEVVTLVAGKNIEKLIKQIEEFHPKNVYIIGTMNDIDRSVESMDFAMRRRFAFKEITPEM